MKGFLLFFFSLSFFFSPLVIVGFDSSSINSAASTRSSVDLHTFASKSAAAFQGGNFPAILGIHNSQVLYNIEKDTEISHALLVAIL